MSFCLPFPCLLGSQSINKPLSSVLGHLLPALIWIMKTWDKDTGWWPLTCVGVVPSTGGSDSDHHSIFCNTEHAVVFLLFTRPSILQSTLRALYVMDVLFFFFFFLVFSYLSVCLGKEWRLTEQEAISFVCNQETLLVPYGWDQGTSALKSSRKKCSSKLVHISHKPKRGFAFPWVWVLADRSFWPEGGDRLTLEDPLSCSKWPRQLLINSSIP